mgnify:CR=1 FL=1
MGDAFNTPALLRMSNVYTLLQETGPAIDPFVGTSALRTWLTVTNDADSGVVADMHLDALLFLQNFAMGAVGVVLLDPPAHLPLRYLEQLLEACANALRYNGVLMLVLRTHTKPTMPITLRAGHQLIMHMGSEVYAITTHRRIAAPIDSISTDSAGHVTV